MLRGQCRGRKLVLPHGRGCLEPVPFDEPACIVDLPKGQQRLTELLDGVEGSHPQEVLLQGPNEALGAAISLGGPHEGGRALDVQEGKLLLEGVGHVLTAMIMPDREPAPDPLTKAAERALYPLPDWFQRLEAGGPACGVDADALC